MYDRLYGSYMFATVYAIFVQP